MFECHGTFGQYASPIISDVRGNGYAVYQQNSLSWYSSRLTAYSAIPGFRPIALTDGADLAYSSAWHGEWVDPTGTCQLGQRPYGLVGSYWYSADSLGHDADVSLYAFCAALNPVAAFDPTGMCANPTADPYGINSINSRRGNPLFRSAQDSMFVVAQGVDAAWDFAAALFFTPANGTGAATVSAIGNPLMNLGVYPQSGSTVHRIYRLSARSDNLVKMLCIRSEPLSDSKWSILRFQNRCQC